MSAGRMAEATGGLPVGRILRWFAIAALIGVLAACGSGRKLPAGQATLQTQESATAQTEPDDAAPPATPATSAAATDAEEDEEDEEDEEQVDEEQEQEQVADEAVLVTADSWVDATANLVGLESDCGTIHYLSAHPFSDELFVGVAANGMFRLDPEAGDWVPIGTDAGSDQIDNRLSWIEYEPTNPDRFWQAGIYGTGVFRTDDGGATFSQQGDISHVDYVSTDPTDPDRAVMLAGGHEARILHRSTDGGATWEDIAETLPEAIGFTAYPVVTDPTTFLLGTFSSDNAGIFRSEDGGATWTTVYAGEISGPPLIDGPNIYWLAHQGNGLIVSNDGGQTFELRPGLIGGRPATLSLLQDGRLLTHGRETALISDDEGDSWSPVGPRLPYDPNGIVISSNESAIYVWKFACNSADEGNDVLPSSILRLDLIAAHQDE